MIIHDLQMLLQLRFFEIDFDENLIFIDSISSSLIDTEMRNSFDADDVKRKTWKSALRFATIENLSRDLCAHSS